MKMFLPTFAHLRTAPLPCRHIPDGEIGSITARSLIFGPGLVLLDAPASFSRRPSLHATLTHCTLKCLMQQEAYVS